MPEDRPPLSPEEKAALKQWIDGGANWTIDFIDPADFEHKTQVGQNFVRRLTVPEYIATVRAATGVDIAAEARELLPPDLRADGFSNTAYNLNIDLKHVEAYSARWRSIAERMDVGEFAERFSKNRSLTDTPMREHIERMGKWMLRGPLEGNEIDAFRGISTRSPAPAATSMRQCVTSSRRCCNRRASSTRSKTSAAAASPGTSVIRTRLAASATSSGGRRRTPARSRPPRRASFSSSAAARRPCRSGCSMIRVPSHARCSSSSDWLNLDRLGNLQPKQATLPEWDPQLAADMRDETLQLFQRARLGAESPAWRICSMRS